MKKKLKGLLSLWLAVVLVMVTTAVPVRAEGSHGDHTESGWQDLSNIPIDYGKTYNLGGNYYLHNDIAVSGCSVTTSTVICLNGKNLENFAGNALISVGPGGNLTVDDCKGTGICYVPFNVKSGGILNIQGGNYYSTSEITVESGGTLNIQGGTYYRTITVATGGKLNISAKAGRTTKVGIYAYADPYRKIAGQFTLIDPQENYYTTSDNKIKVFSGWYVMATNDHQSVPSKAAITGGSYTLEDIDSQYHDLWKIAESSGSAELFSEWADGHTVTYKYNDGSASNKTIGVVSGEVITLDTPTKSGYTFNGWLLTDPSEQTQTLVGGTSFKPTANTTLTAQWRQNSGGGSGGNTSSGGNTPSGGNTVTPPGTTPDNDSGKDNKTTDWNPIKSDVTKAKDGDTVTIDLSKDTTVPGEIFDSIRGKDVTLVLDLGNGMSWRINGNSITADKIGNMNFSVDFDSKTIPVEVINKVSGERYTMRLSLAHDGPFGMEAVLSVDLDEKNAGLYANLFYFNPDTEELEFVEDDIITDKGAAEFTFTHASDYAIIIDKESMDPSIPAKGTKLTDRKTKAVYKVTKAGKTGGTVAYMGSTDKTATKIVIPATVTIDGITYKVTSVGAKAFIKNKTLQKITIGKNVKKIGKKAFYGCRNLKKIVIKTTRLTDETVGNKAFQKIAAKAKIRVPEEKLDAYSKLLKGKGLGDKAVVKK